MSLIFLPDQELYIEKFKPKLTENLDDLLGLEPYKSFEYWCCHFASILECLHYHINLEESPRRLTNYPDWSLKDLRGHNSANYFRSIRKYLTNWGFQYFLVHFLNSDLGLKLSGALRNAIADVNEWSDLEKFRYYKFEMAGVDSALSKLKYLQDLKKRRNVQSKDKHVAYNSDLALIYSRSRKPQVESENFVAFGEIEGNYGHKLLKGRFWDHKHPELDFGIGIVKGKKPKNNRRLHLNLNTEPQVTLDYIRHWSGSKVVLLIKQEHDIVKDYHDAIQLIRDIYYDGPRYRVLHNLSPELKDACNLLVTGFDTPILDLLDQFEDNSIKDNFIDSCDDDKQLIIRTDI
nr:hypothetical protein [uncultured Acinetobacter sp.]